MDRRPADLLAVPVDRGDVVVDRDPDLDTGRERRERDVAPDEQVGVDRPGRVHCVALERARTTGAERGLPRRPPAVIEGRRLKAATSAGGDLLILPARGLVGDDLVRGQGDRVAHDRLV
jgi:hypothetical protein